MRVIATRLLVPRVLVLLLAGLMGACGSDDDSGEFYTTWDLAGGCSNDSSGADRSNAEGEQVDVCADVVGRWTWISYGALWCSTSRQQAPPLARFARTAPHELEVYAVLTGGDAVFVPASQRDAKAWSRSYGLPASRVLFGPDEGARTVPQHLLIGPDGRTWYRYVGFLDVDAMTRLAEDFVSGVLVPDVRDLGVR